MPDITYLANHEWVGAARIPLSEPEARRANRLGSHRMGAVKTRVCDVNCDTCGRGVTDTRGCKPRCTHAWGSEVWIPLTDAQATTAMTNGAVTVEGQVIDIVEVMCHQCRLPHDDVVVELCTIGIHLHGGPIGTRAKRKGRGSLAVEGDTDTDEDTD